MDGLLQRFFYHTRLVLGLQDQGFYKLAELIQRSHLMDLGAKGGVMPG